MLRIVVNNSTAAAKRYYTQGLTLGDYYQASRLVAGTWAGRGAERLGLSSTVERRDFHGLCDNRQPNGDPLTARTKANRRVGFDLNFHCPKSVSLVHAFGGDVRVEEVFRAAVLSTMNLVELDACTRVRRGGRSEDRVSGNLVWATFVHETSRPVDGVPDPHLHAHCFVFNATYDETENAWKAAQLGNIKRDAPFYEAHFHAELAAGLRALGYGVSRAGKYWQIAGVPDDLLRRFSSRTRQIDAAAAALGITDAELKAGLGAATRAPKGDAKPWAEVQAQWRERLSPVDMTALRSAREGRTQETAGMTAREALEQARVACLGVSAVVPERLLLETALRLGFGHVRLQDLVNELPSVGLAPRSVRGQPHLADEKRMADEREMLAFARATRGHFRLLLDSLNFNPELLDARDRRALSELLVNADQVAIARLRRESCDVVVEWIRAGGHTLLRFNGAALKLPGAELRRMPADNPVWWVDEAQRLGTSQLAALFRCADQNGARVVLAASPGRLSATSPLLLLRTKAGLWTSTWRSRSAEMARAREAERRRAEGRVFESYKRLDEAGAVRESTPERLAADVADAFVQKQRAGHSSRVVVSRESLLKSVTSAIRTAMRSARLLGRPRRFEQLTLVRLSPEARTQGSSYKKGNVIIFFRSIKGFRVAQRYEVVGHDPFGNVLARNLAPRKGLLQSAIPWVEALPLSRPDYFAAFERSTIELAKGDLIRVTMGGKTLNQAFGPELFLPKGTLARNAEFAKRIGLKPPDRRYRVRAGTHHRIKRFTLGGHIELDNGWILAKDFGTIDHGYHDVLAGAAGEQVEVVSRDAKGNTSRTVFTTDKSKLFEAVKGREREMHDEHAADTDVRAARRRARGRHAGRDSEMER